MAGDTGSTMKLKVFCTTDENYLEMTHVMLHSLLVHSRAAISRIDVFGWRLSERGAKALAALAPELIVVHRLRDLPPGLEPIRFRIAGMVATWLRLVAPDMIEANDENLFYIDCDCIVDRDISELATIDLGTKIYGAVADSGVTKHAAWLERLRLPPETPYFNAGIMLFNHRLYREGGWSRKAVAATVANADRLMLHDQDLLNILVAGDWYRLPDSYNAHASQARTEHGGCGELFEGAHIIHYVGRIKPTDADCLHAAREIYHRYRAATVYGGRPLRSGFGRQVGFHLRSAIGKLKRFGAARGLRVS